MEELLTYQWNIFNRGLFKAAISWIIRSVFPLLPPPPLRCQFIFRVRGKVLLEVGGLIHFPNLWKSAISFI